MPQQDFNKSLPDIGSAVANLKKQKLVLPQTVLDDLSQKLVHADTSAPAYWPTAAEFINYRSQIIAQHFQDLLRPDLPKCSDHAPIPMQTTFYGPAVEGSTEPSIEKLSAYYDDCEVTLDSPDEAKKIFDLLDNRLFVLTFRHCRIVWNGGEIALLAQPEKEGQSHKAHVMWGTKLLEYSGRYIRFQDCLFEFKLSSPPVLEGQEFTKQLLEQNGSSFTFPPKTLDTHS